MADTDIVERLRWSAASTEVSEELAPYGKMLDEAAAEIIRLRALYAEAREALEAQEAADEANDMRAGYDTFQALEDAAKALRLSALSKES